ncbi:MAG: hypothetical protein RLZZ298_3038 [Pseudomonadota bacterium]|jgi:hypothetical protein
MLCLNLIPERGTNSLANIELIGIIIIFVIIAIVVIKSQ